LKSLLLFIFILFIFIPIKLYSQYSLIIEINGLRNDNGNVLYELFDQNQKSLIVSTIDITNKKCVIILENIKNGKYAFYYIHDENRNKKLDTKMLFIPKEGFGYSNNVDAKFGPPAFEKWIFELKDNMKMNCHPTYLNY